MSDLRASEDAVKGANPEDKRKDAERAKQMKADLTRTNFSMGTGSKQDEISEYIDRFKQFEVDQMKLERPKETSSIHFGNEKPVYHTINADAMKNHNYDMQDFTKSKEEVEKLKTQLRKHNFTIGLDQEKLNGQTEYEAEYNPVKSGMTYEQLLAEKKKQKAIVLDTRSAHFDLGQDKVEYVSNTHRGQNESAGLSAADNAENLKKAAQIKPEIFRFGN